MGGKRLGQCCYFLSMDGGVTSEQCEFDATMHVVAYGKRIPMCTLHGKAYNRVTAAGEPVRETLGTRP